MNQNALEKRDRVAAQLLLASPPVPNHDSINTAMPRDLYSSDSDGGNTDVEVTPRRKPVAPPLRKRLSGIYNTGNINDDADASFNNSSPGRAPLKPFNVNDDAAEKRRRRKSTKIIAKPSENAEAGTSAEGAEGGTVNKPRRLLHSAAQVPKLNLPKELMSSNYEEWMKLATDNVHLWSPVY